MSKFFKDQQKYGLMHFVVFEKFTSAYLFQIAREKSCDYLLIIYTKNVTTTKNLTGRAFSLVHSADWLKQITKNWVVVLKSRELASSGQ